MAFQSKRTPQMTLSNEEIIELYWLRNEKAIIETDAKYRKYLFSVAYNVLHDKLDCEECLNDTYLGAWNAIPPTRPSMLKAFLTTIVRRIAIKRYHSKLKMQAIPSEMTVALSELEDFISDNENADIDLNSERLGKVISGFIRSLPNRRQFIFMSRYYVSDSIDTIAKDLNVSRSTVNKELAAIRQALKDLLESEGFSV